MIKISPEAIPFVEGHGRCHGERALEVDRIIPDEIRLGLLKLHLTDPFIPYFSQDPLDPLERLPFLAGTGGQVHPEIAGIEIRANKKAVT